MTKITSEEYRNMNKKGKAEPSGNSRKLTTQEALKAMGHYFELNEKSVEFWIKQMQLSNKI